VKASVHKRLKQLEQVRAADLEAERYQEREEDGRLVREKLMARVEAYIQEHGIPEEPPEGLAKAVQNLRYQLMERAAGRL
jgi:hypothetical protein